MREEELKAQEAAIVDRDAELEQAAQEQTMERSRLEKLKEEAEATQASLAEAEKAATMERGAFVSLEARFRRRDRKSLGAIPRVQQ